MRILDNLRLTKEGPKTCSVSLGNTHPEGLTRWRLKKTKVSHWRKSPMCCGSVPHIPLPSSRAPCYWGGQGKEVLSFDLQLHARSFLGMMQSSPLEIKIYSKMVSHFWQGPSWNTLQQWWKGRIWEMPAGPLIADQECVCVFPKVPMWSLLVESGHLRWLLSCSLYIPWETSACFACTLHIWLTFWYTCSRPQQVIFLIKWVVRGVPLCPFPW